ncbi:hypothetical protein A9K66_08450 [Mesorhizobium sp. AA23]|nr:hypothetical protein A9K66_08450 [Mesorhizobium sp. AA23]
MRDQIPDNPRPRPLQAESDRKLLAQTRDVINRSRQKLIDTEPQIDPHRLKRISRKVPGV